MVQDSLIDHLAHNAGLFEQLFSDSGDPEIRWKPAPDKWCLLEVLCHLRDEECEDFRARLKLVLEAPGTPLPAIDPVAWVSTRRYMEQDISMVLDRFLLERKASVEWLHGLKQPLWSNSYVHPKLGPMSGDHFLANWVAHDLHHIRQITNLRYGYLNAVSDEDLSYAGNW